MQEDIARLRGEGAQLAYQSSLAINAIIKSRIINERRDEDGGDYGEYSASYQRVRAKKNLTGTLKNFSFTNKMWATTLPRVESENNGVITIVIEPDSTNRDKMDYQNQRHGKRIMGLNHSEILKLHEIYKGKVNIR